MQKTTIFVLALGLIGAILIILYPETINKTSKEPAQDTGQIQRQEPMPAELPEGESTAPTPPSVEQPIVEKEQSEKEKLQKEFDDAFFAQYKVPDSCQNVQSENHMVRCHNLQIQARQEFQHQFLLQRGLPPDALDSPQIHFSDE